MKCLKLQEAAERLGISRQAVRQLIDAGELEAINVGGGKLRRRFVVPDYAIDNWIGAQLGKRNKKAAPKRAGRPKRDYVGEYWKRTNQPDDI